MKKKFYLPLVALLSAALAFTGCAAKEEAAPADDQGAAAVEETASYPEGVLDFIAPGGAGGGWDLTIRTTAKVLQDANLVDVPMPITNKPGGGGGVTLAHMQTQKGGDDMVVVYSSPLLLINLNGSTELSYKDTTPLARLIADYGAFVVAKDSEYTSITEIMDALKEDPKSVKIGGNSAVGSMDHIQFLMMAKAAGVENLKEIDYVSFQDGSATAQILGGHVDLLSTGLGDVGGLLESGDLRCLAQTADKRVGADFMAEIPSCKELGIDGVFVNWRGLFGPPEMPDYAVEYWEDTLAAMVETDEWKEASKNNGWDIIYQDSAEFTSFLEEVNTEYETILKDIGMIQ